jgi:hypothetical protein
MSQLTILQCDCGCAATLLQHRCGTVILATNHPLSASKTTLFQSFLAVIGLEVIPTNMPIEMLVVEKAK